MQNTENKGKFVGEIAVILGLQLIMLIFRLVEPINWLNIFPGEYTTFLNEFAYFGIEFILLIVLVAHFIFGISFKELGLCKIRENIGSFLLNLLFLGASVGVSYFMSLFSKNVEIHWLELICQIITNFVAIAFLKEVIFRGFLIRSLCHLMNGKGIIASSIAAVFFAATYLPSILINLHEISVNAVLQGLIIPFIMGIYLGLVYYYTQNLWMSTIFHGTFISLLGLEQDFAICGIEIVYVTILVIYLICKMVCYYKGEQILEDEILEEDFEQSKYTDLNETVSHLVEEHPIEECSSNMNLEKRTSYEEDLIKQDDTLVDNVETVTLQQKFAQGSVVEPTSKAQDMMAQERQLAMEQVSAMHATRTIVTIPSFPETNYTQYEEKVTIAKQEAERIPEKMLSALDDLHEELKQKVKEPVEVNDLDCTLESKKVSNHEVESQGLLEAEEEKTLDLMSVLSMEIEEDEETN
ncbi:MAG: CPBP family intramembrane metalloprotease [Cellulosilyticum sp.]|nr:CPBP family intramembrane metalloprotease [Cellulosilyticum sp.]